MALIHLGFLSLSQETIKPWSGCNAANRKRVWAEYKERYRAYRRRVREMKAAARAYAAYAKELAAEAVEMAAEAKRRMSASYVSPEAVSGLVARAANTDTALQHDGPRVVARNNSSRLRARRPYSPRAAVCLNSWRPRSPQWRASWRRWRRRSWRCGRGWRRAPPVPRTRLTTKPGTRAGCRGTQWGTLARVLSFCCTSLYL